MDRKRLFRILIGGLFISALAIGYRAFLESNHAQVVVEWSTSSEIDTAGFNLYRSESPLDVHVQINAHLIPASPDSLTGGEYQYLDKDVVPGRIYYYRLEEVETSGTTTHFGPIEVEAERRGMVEIILAITFAVMGMIGMYFLIKDQDKYINDD